MRTKNIEYNVQVVAQACDMSVGEIGNFKESLPMHGCFDAEPDAPTSAGGFDRCFAMERSARHDASTKNCSVPFGHRLQEAIVA